jgi:hypothetical protein
LERLQSHAANQNAQAWYISRSGFTEEALHYAGAHQVFITDSQGLEELLKLCG